MGGPALFGMNWGRIEVDYQCMVVDGLIIYLFGDPTSKDVWPASPMHSTPSFCTTILSARTTIKLSR